MDAGHIPLGHRARCGRGGGRTGVLLDRVCGSDPDGRWYVSLAVDTQGGDGEEVDSDEVDGEEVDGERFEPAEHAVDVDLGVKDFAVTSDVDRVAGPRLLERKASYERRMPPKQRGSDNRVKAARAHRKVREARRDFLHRAGTHPSGRALESPALLQRG
ncbi:hypothetical protein [Nonomuraea sp. CA-141351]|uniref:hypothetical protein n=1 Tax=Nonomuraea sp. CA-141351 TaxID=3239996 RepID=UPI003D907FF4